VTLVRGWLAAYSCGVSSGIAARAAHRIPCCPRPCVVGDRDGTYLASAETHMSIMNSPSGPVSKTQFSIRGLAPSMTTQQTTCPFASFSTGAKRFSLRSTFCGEARLHARSVRPPRAVRSI